MTKIEPRYVVLKLKDVYSLPTKDIENLQDIINKVMLIRKERGADPTMRCLVVEADWPEFEPTAEAILRRSSKQEQLELPLDNQPVDTYKKRCDEVVLMRSVHNHRPCGEQP